jgi:hypothetical protein
MKKLLLSLVAFVATMGAFAQDGWEKSFTPVSDAKELSGVHVAQAGDGSVYASSTYNQAFTFAGKSVKNDDAMTSAVIVKYDKTGAEQWAVTVYGKAEVTAMISTADGTLYAAGTYKDNVTFTDAEGMGPVVAYSEDYTYGFVMKVDANGSIKKVEVLAVEPDPDLIESGLYYPEGLYCTPNAIKLNDDRVYVAASYNANVPSLGWQAAYLNVFDFMYMENRSKGVFSLSADNLADPKSELTVQNTERISYDQYYPEALNFDFDDKGNVCFAFVGFGNLTLATPNGSKNFTFETTDDESGMKEHALVGGAINGTDINANIYHAEKNDGEAIPYSIVGMYAQDGVIYLGGTAYGNFWFDSSVTNAFTYAYVTAIDMSTSAAKWSKANDSESKAVIMNVMGENVFLATDKAIIHMEAATGKSETGTTIVADASDCSNYAAVAIVNDNKVTVNSRTVIEEEEEEGLILIPQSQGKEYDDFARAELVEGEDYNTYTVNADLTIAIKMMDVDVEGCDYVLVRFAEPVAAGWKIAFWNSQELVDIPAGETEFKYEFANDPLGHCDVVDGILPQICMMTFFGGYEAPLVAKVVGIYKHKVGGEDAIEKINVASQKANGKYFQNGQVFILKNGVKYNMAGQRIK